MASKSAGKISISLSAGTAEFIASMDRANAKIRDFGVITGGAHREAVSGMQATSATLRVLEGGFNNNLRAAERFASSVLGLGPILQAAFPVVGAIAFIGLLGRMSEEVSKLYTAMKTSAEKLSGTFTALQAPLQMTNDELALSNARLEADIAKLEGRRENTLKIALLEAVEAADKLADALDNDLSKINEFLEKNKPSIGETILSGGISDKGLRQVLGGQTGQGGFVAEVAGINEAGRARIAAAKTEAEQTAARKALDDQLRAAYNRLLNELTRERDALVADQAAFRKGSALYNNYTKTLEEYAAVISVITKQATPKIPLLEQQTLLTQKKTELTGAAQGAKLEAPFDTKLAQLKEQLDAATNNLRAAGLGEAEKAIAMAQNEALKAIEEVNKRLREQGQTSNLIKGLEDARAKQFLSLALDTAKTTAAAEYLNKVKEISDAYNKQIAQQNLITAAIGKGYEAVKAAAVEAEVMAKFSPEKYAAGGAEIAYARAQAAEAYEAKHNEELAKSSQELRDQITLQNALTVAQAQGQAAVKLATLQYNLALMARNGATKELIALETERFYAEQRNAAAESVFKVNEQIDAIHRLTAARLQGADAVRQAELQNKLATISAKGDQAIPGVIGVGQEGLLAMQEAGASNEDRIAEAASKRVNVYADQLRQLGEEQDYLLKMRNTMADTADIDRTLRDIEDAKLKILVEEELAQRNAAAGVRAFFLEMQTQAKSAASIIYDTLTSALDKISDNLSKALTGQKTEWAKMFKSLGEEGLKASIKSSLQTGLGQLGKAFPSLSGPLSKLGLNKADGSSPERALWVRMAGAGAGIGAVPAPGGGGYILNGNGGILGTGQVPILGGGSRSAGEGGGGVGGFFGTLLRSFGIPIGGGGGGGSSSATSTITYPGMASGGDLTPGQMVWTGEHGPELFRSSVGGRIYSAGESRQMFGGKSGDIYVDARGSTDPYLTRQRVEAGIRASHAAAVSMSVRAVHEQTIRTPRRG